MGLSWFRIEPKNLFDIIVLLGAALLPGTTLFILFPDIAPKDTSDLVFTLYSFAYSVPFILGGIFFASLSQIFSNGFKEKPEKLESLEIHPQIISIIALGVFYASVFWLKIGAISNLEGLYLSFALTSILAGIVLTLLVVLDRIRTSHRSKPKKKSPRSSKPKPPKS